MMIFEGQEWIHSIDWCHNPNGDHNCYRCVIDTEQLIVYDDGRWRVDSENYEAEMSGSENDLHSAMKRAIKIYNVLTEVL